PSCGTPPIFASSPLLLPTTVANFNAGQGGEWMTWITTQLGHGRPLFLVLYIALIVFFAFFYTAIVFNPTETADNLKKHGGFIPGIRPGERTAEHIDYVLSRITVIGESTRSEEHTSELQSRVELVCRLLLEKQ